MRIKFWQLMVVALGSICFVSAASGGTRTVTSIYDSGSGSLRQAINDAAAGDTIYFLLPAQSVISLTSGELLINKSLTINGPGADRLRVERSLESGGNFRIFNIQGSGTVTISGLTIAYGSTTQGGGIYTSVATLTIASCHITHNTGSMAGGAVMCVAGNTTITNSSLTTNNAYGGQGHGIGGAIYIEGGGVSVVNSTLSANYSGGAGGGIYNWHSAVTLTQCTLTQNRSFGSDGGGVYNDQGNVYVLSTIIAGNIAFASGPDFQGTINSLGWILIGNINGMVFSGSGTGVKLNVDPNLASLGNNGGPTPTHALLSGSPAIDAGNSGGSSTDQRGLARPVDSPTVSNVAGADGSDIGAYEIQPDQLPGCNTINSVVNNGNDSGPGSLRSVIAGVCNGTTITFASNVGRVINLTSGELWIDKSLTINGPGANLLSVQRNGSGSTADFRIFGIAAKCNATLSGLTIIGGKAGSALGGGVFNAGVLNLAGCNVSNNSASGGGGIYGGVVNVTDSTIMGNEANGAAGIYADTLNISNSTIYGNKAKSSDGGGIIGTNVNISNSTISGNSAAEKGGGLLVGLAGRTVRVRNTIIALNAAPTGSDVYGVLISENFNLIGNTSGLTITPAQFGDLLGGPGSPIDPRFGSFGNNGGPTPTLSLLPNSPALDHGSSLGLFGSLSTDQRGLSRTVDIPSIPNVSNGDGTDMGAFELLPPRTGLGNISTRLRVETGDNALIGGFIVTGNQPKKVIVRGIGPSLPFADKLQNPTLELYGPNGLIEANDDWGDSPNIKEIIDSTIAPSSSRESAIVATLPANNSAYTAIVRGVGGSTGIGVVEAYDLDTPGDSRLANISTRGFVSTGDNILIAGTIVVGYDSQKVIVRAMGPSLPLAGHLENPALELRDQNGGLVDANDNWVDSPNKQAIIDSTVPPTNDLESAIVQTLPANGASYTAIVRGVSGATGIAVVEVYALR